MYPANKSEVILQRALTALNINTGLVGQITAREPIVGQKNRKVDARVEILAHGQSYIYLAEVKRIDRFAQLVELKYRQDECGNQMLLVAPRITNEIADKCRELKIQFIDAAGNVYLQNPSLYILVKGLRPFEEDSNTMDQEGKRAGTATHLRICFALLCKPELLNAPYREINKIAGVALGTIGWVFVDLNARGYATGDKGEGGRILLEKQRLMQEWVTNYPIKLRPKLNQRRFRAPTADWWKQLDVTQYGAQWGAEVAAAELTGHLRPHTFTLYFHKTNRQQNLTKFVVDHKLRPDAQGDIEILDTFWEFEDENPIPNTVPPLLIYADLIATLDPRNLETAKLVFAQYDTPTIIEG